MKKTDHSDSPPPPSQQPNPDSETENISKENGVLEGKLDSLFDNNDCKGGNHAQLEDSELSGVSSLLKMQRSGSLGGLDSVLDVIEKEEEEEETVDWGKDTDFEFAVGDFVWGKVKSHPWWPGRIYDSDVASPLANKVKHRQGKLLVAYFGDATFAWCYPSKLIPFTKHFTQMSKQSSSKGFVNALNKALDEFGTLLEMNLTCRCLANNNLIGLGTTSSATNAGIKDGVLVPKLGQAGVQPFTDASFEPARIVDLLKSTAQDVKVTSTLDFTFLKSWLSAFYNVKGGYSLPKYYDPLPVLGLEDDSNGSLDEFNHDDGMVSKVQEPVKEDLISSLTGRKPDEVNQSSQEMFQGVSDDKVHHSRKQRSIAEILGVITQPVAENKDDDVLIKDTLPSSNIKSSAKKKRREDKTEIIEQNASSERENELQKVEKEGMNSGRTVASVKKKKMNDENKSKGGNVVKAATDLGETTPSIGTKKRKVGDKVKGEDQNEVADKHIPEEDLDNPISSLSKKRKVGDKAKGEGKKEVTDKLAAGKNVGKDKALRGKKNKVIDEAKGMNQNKVDDNKTNAEKNTGKSISPRGRKRKVSDDVKGEDKNEVDDKPITGKTPQSSQGKKTKKGDDSNVEDQNEIGDKHRARKNPGRATSQWGKNKSVVETENHDDDGSLLKSRRQKKKSLVTPHAGVDMISSNEVNETHGVDNSSAKSEKSKRKELSESHPAADNKVSDHEVTANNKKKVTRKTPISKKTEDEESRSAVNDDLKKHIKDSVAREKKKSKYLSPPYTNVSRGKKRIDGEAESRKISAEAQVGKRMSKAASNLIGSPPITEAGGKKFEMRPAKELCTGPDGPDSSGPEAPNLVQEKSIDRLKLKAPANEVLSRFRSAALNPELLKQNNSWDTVEGFLLAFRSSIYRDGSCYEVGGKKSEESIQGSSGKQQKQVEHSSPENTETKSKTKRSEVKKSDKCKVKEPEVKADETGRDGNAPAAALFVTFDPGSSIPTKKDLLKMYKRFGTLNKKETKMMQKSNCARIVFLRSSDAEEAFNESQLSSPFAPASVKFRLEYLSDETKTREVQDIALRPEVAKVAKTPGNKRRASVSKAAAGNTSELESIKQKLEKMTTMVQNSDGKMTEDTRSKLEDEAKALLEKVSGIPRT